MKPPLKPQPPVPAAKTTGLTAGSGAGFLIGILSGYTGVGGGEYRSPVLLLLLRDIRWTIAANLAIGLVVSAFTFLLRGGYGLPADQLLLAMIFAAGSLPGGYVGAVLTRRIRARELKILLAGILVVTGLRLILVETGAGRAFVLDAAAVTLALAFGFALGMISGLLGLAAGEYRIPTLILFFGLPTKAAGTVSSLAAIPQQLIAHWKHRRLGHMNPISDRLAAAMATASVAGVVLGVLFLGRTTDVLVTRILGLAMVAAAVRIAWEVRHPDPSEAARQEGGAGHWPAEGLH